MKLLRALITIAAAMATMATYADGQSAAQNLFSNLARSKSTIDTHGNVIQVAPTLVRGIYALSDQHGGFIGYTNDGGTLYGDSQGFNVVSTDGSPLRSLNTQEMADLRIEVMAHLAADQLIKVPYGDGHYHLLLFSAIDCPACKSFEGRLRQSSAQGNTVFYVIPSSLQPIASGGAHQWQMVSNIWCANDSGRAWKTYWASGAIPVGGVCPFADAHVAEDAVHNLTSIMQGVGIRVLGTPTFVREDGVVLHKGASDMNPHISGPIPHYWLTTNDKSDDFHPRPVSLSSASAVEQSQPTKINLGDALKKFLH